MTQTPLEREQAAGVVAAGADLSQAPEGATEALEVRADRRGVRARLAQSPKGLLAVGALVTGVLLSTAAIVWVATAAPRRHPWATALALRRR